MTAPSSRRRGRPVDAELHARRRQQILEAAIRLFGQHGYLGTDTQQLANALRVGKGTIYRYFRSKRELFYSALRHVMAQLDQDIQVSISGISDPLLLSFRAATAYLRFFQTHPSAIQMLLQELVHFRQEGLPAYFQYRQQTLQRWVAHLEQLMASGIMRPVSALLAVEIMGDSLFGIMLANFLTNRQRPPEIQAREVLHIFYRGLLTEQGQIRLQLLAPIV